MTLITTTNKGSAMRRVTTLLSVGGALVLTYFGFRATQSFFEGRPFAKNRSGIEKAIKENNTYLADQYLKNMKPETDLRKRDHIRLTATVEKMKTIEKAEQYIKAGKSDSAIFIAENNKAISENERDAIKKNAKKKMYEDSEEGLYKLVHDAGAEKKYNACIEYLSRFKNGKYEDKVLKYLLGHELQSIVRGEKNVNCGKQHSKIEHFNAFLDDYKSKGLSLEGAITKKELEDSIRRNTVSDYFTHINSWSMISAGTTVQVSPSNQSSFDGKYYTERNNIIPKGSIGKIIELNKEYNRAYVKFEDITEYKWSKDWSAFSSYWKDGKKDVASYKLDEVMIGTEMNPFEKKIIQEELGRTFNLMTKYYGWTGKNVK